MKLFEVLSFEILTEETRQEYIAKNMDAPIMAAIQNDSSARGVHDSLDAVKILSKADPTENRLKFIQFITRMYVKGQFKFEDLDRLKKELELFGKVQHKLQNKDLNSYQTLAQLYDTLEPFETKKADIKTKGEKERDAKAKGAQTIYDTPDFKLIHLKTAKASCFYAAGTKWCTSDAETFKGYAKQGPIYVVIARDKKKDKVRKFQFHMPKGGGGSLQFMDERDQHASMADIAFISSFPEWRAFIEAKIKEHHFAEESAKKK